jgi:type IV pilus assembly protein PilA
MKNIKTKKAGFSLVELMVVVAIIGILASIAVPNFLKFQGKAKQSDAKVQLSGIHGAQKTFFSEYGTFHPNLPYVGFIPDGIPLSGLCPDVAAGAAWNVRNYTVGFNSLAAAPAPQVAALPNLTTTCPVTAGNGVTFYDRGPTGSTFLRGAPATATAQVTAVGAFLAAAEGLVGQTTTVDIWTINQDKVLRNEQPGI